MFSVATTLVSATVLTLPHIRPVPLLTVFCSLKWNRNGEVPCPSPGACLPSCPDPRRLLRDTGSFLRQPCGERARTSAVLGTSTCPVGLRGGSSETASRPPNSGPPRQPGPRSAPTGSSAKQGSCGEGGGGALLRGTRVRRLEPPRWALTQTDARPRPSASLQKAVRPMRSGATEVSVFLSFWLKAWTAAGSAHIAILPIDFSRAHLIALYSFLPKKKEKKARRFAYTQFRI